MDKNKKYQTSDLVIIFLAFIIIQLILGVISYKLLANYNLTWLQTSLVTCLTFSLIIYWQLNSKQVAIKSYFTNPTLPSFQLVGLLLAGLGLSIILSEVNNIIHCLFPLPKSAIKQINQLMTAKTNFLASGIILVVASAIIKEFFFRGLILQGLLANYTWKKAAAFTILLQLIMNFSFYHIIGTFTLSLLLNWLYLKSKSLVLCIVGNIFYLTIPYLFLYHLPFKISGYNTKLTLSGQFQPLWFNLLGILLFGLGAFILTNTLSNHRATR